MSKQPASRDGISVAIPVHNAADRLEKAVPPWGDALVRLGRDYEIIVVDDGSTDATPAILETFAAGRVRHLQVARHDSPRGYGACLRTAVEYARMPLFFYTGLDYPYSTNDLAKLLQRIEVRDEFLNRQPDLISGCRTGRPVPLPVDVVGNLWRLLCRVALGLQIAKPMAWPGLRQYLYGQWVKWTLGVPFADVNSKFKLYRTEFLKRFPIQSDGEFVHAELAAKATFLTSIMDELPLTAAAAEVKPGPVWRDFWRVSTTRTSATRRKRRPLSRDPAGSATLAPAARIFVKKPVLTYY